jgi:hypothetical protein
MERVIGEATEYLGSGGPLQMRDLETEVNLTSFDVQPPEEAENAPFWRPLCEAITRASAR